MASSDMFKGIFRGVSLEIEDLYLLESFQIGYFRDLVPEKEFAAVLHAYPSIHSFLVKRCPDITDYIERVLAEHYPAPNEKDLEACIDKIVWTVADLIVYNKCPKAYDSLEFHGWDFREITVITSLDDKVVIDCGAGTGRVTLEAARTARYVYAVEPVARLRQFIREKVAGNFLKNVFVMDGFLHSIPLPDNFADILITSHALGWQLQEELWEFERVVKKGGFIIHCPGTVKVPPEEQHVHHHLISPDWRYEYAEYRESDGWKRKYWKQL
jgi:ubiquinone/menaquinone biosynthesis C-methylase UbiE